MLLKINLQDRRFYGQGDTTGRLNGVNYFCCYKNCGVFVSWDKLYPPSCGSDDAGSDTSQTGLVWDVEMAASRDTLSSFLPDDKSTSLQMPQQTEHYSVTGRSDNGNQQTVLERHREEVTTINTSPTTESLSSYSPEDDREDSLLITHQSNTVGQSANENLQPVPEQHINTDLEDLTKSNTSTASEREWWEIPLKDVHISSGMVLRTGQWGSSVTKGILHGQKVAVKRLHRDIVTRLPSDYIRREMRLMAQVHHPNLLLFIGAAFDPDSGPLIITELLDRTLQSAYEDQILEEHSKLPILRDVASALNYLHSHCPPIVHKDVSSSNVLLEALRDDSWKAKVSDFGSFNLIRLTKTPNQGDVVYDAAYSAPLTQMEAQLQTPKTDVYSFGILLHEITLSKFPSDHRKFLSVSLPTNADPQIYQLVQNCTKSLPHERPTMNEILTQIDEMLS